MKDKYPTFNRGELKKIFSDFPEREKKKIEEYVRYRAISVTSEEKLKDIRRNIAQFKFIIRKELDSINLNDLRDFLTLLNQSDRTDEGKNNLKIDLKNFLRWAYKDWSERFDELKDIKTTSREKSFNHQKINSSTLLTKEEIEKIMKAETNLFWKAFFITLYESGLRPIELRNLKWKDLNFEIDGEISELNIFATKTKQARTVYIKEATHYLKRLREEKGKSEYVFPQKSDENRPVTKFAISMWMKHASKKAIGRPIFPYLLRHTRATELYKNAGIPDKTAQKFMGHSKNMSDFYTHLSKDDVREAMSKTVYQLEEMPEKKKYELEIKYEQLEKKLDFVMKNLRVLQEASEEMKQKR